MKIVKLKLKSENKCSKIVTMSSTELNDEISTPAAKG